MIQRKNHDFIVLHIMLLVQKGNNKTKLEDKKNLAETLRVHHPRWSTIVVPTLMNNN